MITSSRATSYRRSGIALLAVLSAIVAIAALGAASSTRIALENLRLDRNRLRVRARWSAEGCANVALAELENQLRLLALTDPRRAAIDSVTIPSVVARTSTCVVTLRPLGTEMTVADRSVEARLTSFLRLTLGPSAQSDSLAAALLDWEDADTDARPLGAESEWYNSRGRLGPRNAPILSDSELALVRGFEREDLRGKVDGLIGANVPSVCAVRSQLPVLAARLGTSLDISAQIRRADDAGLAFERRSSQSLSARNGSSGRATYSVAPSFACDSWLLEAKTAVGLKADTVAYAATLTILGTRVAILGVETDR